MRTRTLLALATFLIMPGCGDEPTSPGSAPATQPPATPPAAAVETDSVILMVAGDFHADCKAHSVRAKANAAIVRRYPEALVVPMGDDAGFFGTTPEFQCYDQSWGEFRSRTYAVLGNHEIMRDTTGKAYYDYFNGVGVDSGRAGHRGRGYYTLDYGGWRILVANSNRLRKVQTAWLTRMLAASPTRCTMAIWHRPLFTSSAKPGNVQVDTGIRPWWQALYNAGADVVLNGHAHNYERFAELRPDGVVDTARGLREFVVGTGGASLYPFNAVPRQGSLKRINSYGVIKLTLWPSRYSWQFIDTAGVVLDQGQDTCH